MAGEKTNSRQQRTSKTKRSRVKAGAPGSGDDPELSPAQMRELERRIEDLNGRSRYLIVCMLGTNFVLYYNLSEDTYGWNDPAHATLFKRRKAAQTILQLIGAEDTLAECRVNKRGQLIKKSVVLPKSTSHPKAIARKRTRPSTRTAITARSKRTSKN